MWPYQTEFPNLMNDMTSAQQLDTCEHLILAEIGEPEENALRIVVDEALVLDRTESIEINGVSLSGIRPIEVTTDSRRFELIWGTYVSYAVRDESYCRWDDTEEWQGEQLRIYSKSTFLDFVAAGTFADDEYPGPFKHYAVHCGNHIVDVASESAPIVRCTTRQHVGGSLGEGSKQLVWPAAGAGRTRKALMDYLKRSALAAFGAFLILVLYTLAAQPLSMWESSSLLLLLLVGAACAVVAGVIAAALVRKHPVAMVLLAQVLIILIVGFIWQQ